MTFGHDEDPVVVGGRKGTKTLTNRRTCARTHIHSHPPVGRGHDEDPVVVGGGNAVELKEKLGFDSSDAIVFSVFA